MDFDSDDNLDYQLNKVASVVIKEKRLSKGYSLEELANKLNNIVTRQSLYRYETNEARMKNNIFSKICLALDENPNDVWNEINNRFINNQKFDNGEIVDISSNTVKIPVYGTIKAGLPLESQTDITEYVEIPKEWTKGGKEFYGIKLSGDSMFPKYQDGDIVIFEHTEDWTRFNGKDCAIMINGTESTFKKVTINDNGIVLQPYNFGAYDIMMFNYEQIEQLPIKIMGIAVEKRTKIN